MVVKTATWKMDSGEAVVEHTDGGATELDEEENGTTASGSGDGRRR
jgi:hypothetical protein